MSGTQLASSAVPQSLHGRMMFEARRIYSNTPLAEKFHTWNVLDGLTKWLVGATCRKHGTCLNARVQYIVLMLPVGQMQIARPIVWRAGTHLPGLCSCMPRS